MIKKFAEKCGNFFNKGLILKRNAQIGGKSIWNLLIKYLDIGI